MTDYFALLGEERRPWVDPERIKETFHRLSREWHPDQHQSNAVEVDGARPKNDFAALNQAQQTLRDSKMCLRHLLELEFPDVSVSGPSTVPSGLADLMFPVQGLLTEANGFLTRRSAAASDLSRALLAGEGFELQERIEEKLADLENQLARLMVELRKFDAERWDSKPADCAAVLLGFYHGFAYLSRWTGQFQEQLFQLAS